MLKHRFSSTAISSLTTNSPSGQNTEGIPSKTFFRIFKVISTSNWSLALFESGKTPPRIALPWKCLASTESTWLFWKKVMRSNATNDMVLLHFLFSIFGSAIFREQIRYYQGSQLSLVDPWRHRRPFVSSINEIQAVCAIQENWSPCLCAFVRNSGFYGLLSSLPPGSTNWPHA